MRAQIPVSVNLPIAPKHDHATARIGRIKPDFGRAVFRQDRQLKRDVGTLRSHAASVVSPTRGAPGLQPTPLSAPALPQGQRIPLGYAHAMRVIYSTPRLENAERVAQLLEQEGVSVRLLFGPHYKRNTWRGANYRQTQNPGDWPRVLVLNNGDLPRARAVLRTAGLLSPAPFERGDTDELAAPSIVFNKADRTPADPGVVARRIRLALIAVVLLIAVIQAVRLLM